MQRILALGALALAMLLHLGTVRSEMGTEDRLVQDEVAALGADALQNEFDRIADLPFDAISDADSPNDLTHPNRFGGASWESAVDLADLHGATIIRQVAGPGGAGALSFSLSADVVYVEKDGMEWVETPGNQRSFFKRIRITSAGPRDFQADMERIISFSGI